LSRSIAGACDALFNKLVIGWEVYTAASEVDQEVFIDDLVIGDGRVGCPEPP
jgi:hypothetical protein